MIPDVRDALTFARKVHTEAIEEIDKALASLDELGEMKLDSRANAHQLVKTYMAKLGTTQMPAGVCAELRAAGHDVNMDAIYAAMSRMARKGILNRVGQCHYVWRGDGP